LVPIAGEVIITRASGKRAADPFLVRGYIRGRRVKVTSDVTEGLGVALHMAKPRDLILATGSFYVIGEVRELVLKGKRT
jgi:folylpolyglutamate synthase/dihydropteroate synthase